MDGTIELEIKLTGILNTYLLAEGEECNEFGTEVSPRVQAHHHQRTSSPISLSAGCPLTLLALADLFCLRLDPMIDGINNSIQETEIHPLDAPTGSAENWAGNGFVSK